MRSSKKIIGVAGIILSFLILCGCGKDTGASGELGKRPSTAESMLNASIEELFFNKSLSVSGLKQYTPSFESSGAEQNYWRNMEDALSDLKAYGLEFTDYSIYSTDSEESDSMQTYLFGDPFVDYVIDTCVLYTVKLDGVYNPDLAQNEEFKNELLEALPLIEDQKQISESFFIDVEISSRDGVWYFATDEDGIEDWATQFEFD